MQHKNKKEKIYFKKKLSQNIVCVREKYTSGNTETEQINKAGVLNVACGW